MMRPQLQYGTIYALLLTMILTGLVLLFGAIALGGYTLAEGTPVMTGEQTSATRAEHTDLKDAAAETPGFRFPVRDKPGWWEGWWERSTVFKAVLREGIALLGAAVEDEDETLAVNALEISDFLLWVLADVRLTDPYTFLQAEFTQLANIELEGTIGSTRIDELRRPDGNEYPERPSDEPTDRVDTAEEGVDRSKATRIDDIPPVSRPFVDSEEPLVLIYHTHASEAYAASIPTDEADVQQVFLDDQERNIVRVGNELAWLLQSVYNIPTAHITERYDKDGRGGAYVASERGVRAALQRYPSVKILLDVHRDAAPRSSTTWTHQDVSYAKVLLVLGTNRKLQHDNWRQNQAWMNAIGQTLEEKYPGLLRMLDDGDDDDWTYIRPDRFNQHLAPGAALIEIGGHENTLDEALRTAHLVAEVIGELVQQGRYPH